MGQASIGDYALIGDCRGCALVSRRGGIDWLCWPRFDSAPAIFSLLDAQRGGGFTVQPDGPFTSERGYAGESNVLVTRFDTGAGRVRLWDLFPGLEESDRQRRLLPESSLLRLAVCEEGEVRLRVSAVLRPGFGDERVRVRHCGKLGTLFESRSGVTALGCSAPLQPAPGGAEGTVTLRAGQRLAVVLSHATREPSVLLPPDPDFLCELRDRTLRYWTHWAARTNYDGPFREAVVRSALLLKLLSYAPSGAIVAAATTSLPERPGGALNWDYRFCWLRDASLTARALFGLGHLDEADAFISWLLTATHTTRPRVHVLYDVFGLRPRPERERLELSGYRGAAPVREGNAAEGQLQLDVYGELIEAVTHDVRAGGELDPSTRSLLCELGQEVCKRWRQPDEGIWEVRGAPRRFTHSAVLCWVALDRLVSLADQGHLPGKHRAQFARERAAIRAEVEALGVDPARGHFVQALGDRDGQLDSALLVLPAYRFVGADDPRMVRTYAALQRELGLGSAALMSRYRGELTRGEGAFGMNVWWIVEYLALAGRRAEAEAVFAEGVSYANDCGLFAEEILPATGAPMGNFPQAYSHVGLINAALTLQELGRDQGARPRGSPPSTSAAGGPSHTTGEVGT